jgi:hypothetical protein
VEDEEVVVPGDVLEDHVSHLEEGQLLSHLEHGSIQEDAPVATHYLPL